MDQKLNDIKFGLLSDYELYFLIERAKSEKEKRKEKPEEYFDVIYFNDGCEGLYIKEEDLHKIPAGDLKEFIIQTLEQGSELGISTISVEKKEYARTCARYEWNFGDGSNTEVLDEEDEDEDVEDEDLDNEDEDEDDIENFKNK